MGKWDIYVLLMKKELMLEQLRASAREISRAVEDFKPYSKAFIGDLMEGMEQNHSDFMEELEKLLRALKDHKAEKAWEAAQYYSDDVMAVYESWEGTDATVAGKIKGENRHDVIQRAGRKHSGALPDTSGKGKEKSEEEL